MTEKSDFEGKICKIESTIEKGFDNINRKMDKQFEKYDKISDEVIKHGVKLGIMWSFLFGGFTLTAVISIGVALFLKFIIK
jgi:hypothetical protein